jgi:hypothetical protein
VGGVARVRSSTRWRGVVRVRSGIVKVSSSIRWRGVVKFLRNSEGGEE